MTNDFVGKICFAIPRLVDGFLALKRMIAVSKLHDGDEERDESSRELLRVDEATRMMRFVYRKRTFRGPSVLFGSGD